MEDIPVYSYSKLNSFSTCQYEYYLNYVLPPEKRPRSAQNGFSQIGSHAHSVLEDFGKGKILQFELSQRFLDGFDENVPNGVKIYFENGFAKDLTDKYKKQCCDFFDSFTGFKNYKQLSAEDSFKLLIKIRDKTIIFRGIIDSICLDDFGEYHVVDYKSHGEFKSKEELSEYARQLYLYSLYVKYKYGKFPKTLNFLQFRINHTQSIIFNYDDLENCLNWVYGQMESIESENIWAAKCLDEKNKDVPDMFYSRNLCSYRFSCPYSPVYRGDESV